MEKRVLEEYIAPKRAIGLPEREVLTLMYIYNVFKSPPN
jgi:hypothetical protein